jgi:hypothetical protein
MGLEVTVGLDGSGGDVGLEMGREVTVGLDGSGVDGRSRWAGR